MVAGTRASLAIERYPRTESRSVSQEELAFLIKGNGEVYTADTLFI